MPQDRWDRIQEIFLAARELVPEARERFLEAECGDDPALLGDRNALALD